MSNPVLITGCARSGTSMTAGIIRLCGAFGGNTTPPLKHNRKGQFENDRIRNDVVKPYLRTIGADPLGQKPLPKKENIIIPENWESRILHILKDEGLKEGQRWFYKGAKMCLFWEVWHRTFPQAQWIVVRRPDSQIVRSCMRTTFMRAYSTVEGWMEWIEYHKERWKEMEDNVHMRYLQADRLVSGDYSELKKIIKWLGLEYNESKIKDFVEPGLWGGK